ncbi:ABC transporter ATP-binding protein [Beijerinckia sp. L45]|uniref:ABC transporter ATP-binding protein n=1 Tax=Beijerinckia sp. L45 TaxID=1641855 RepID=UPI00131AC290|nr:ABC transporter ATP-binding protein [Beijerinckia sp. L45]
MIQIDHVSKTFAGTQALADCTLTIDDGAFFVLIGPSGCGKSTLLRTINGLIAPDTGTIRVRGKDIATEDPERLRQSIGYVIQSVGLFPHWTVAANIAAVPQLMRWDKGKIARRVDEIVALLRIDPALLPRYPHQLSGGQRQRIGVARALAAGPDLILMDEPFSALDPVSRVELQAEMRRVHAESKTTIVMVTHDVGEALSLATTLAIMRAGRIIQIGTPAAVVGAPADDFVAQFLGGPERFLHLLDVLSVGAAMSAEPPSGAMPRIATSASLRAALSLMMAEGAQALAVGDGDGASVGTLRLDAIVAASHA